MRQLPSLRQMVTQLVAIPSISSVNPLFDQGNIAVIEQLANWCEGVGFTCRIEPLPGVTGKANLIAQLGTGEGGLVFAGHSDTVPCDPERWQGDPWVVREQEGRLYGLGSCDMKSFFAVALEAAAQLRGQRLRHPLYLVATADEESTMHGAKHLLREQQLQARYAVIGEPTEMVPIRLHKGITMQQLRIVGRSGHSSDPALGRSALEGMQQALTLLLAWRESLQRRFPHPAFAVPHPTLNLGYIRGGDNPNRICGECLLHFDLRSVPPMVWSELRVELLERLQPTLSALELEWSLDPLDVEVPPFETAAEAPLVQALERLSGRPAGSVAFASEAPFLQQLGMETVIFGPGEIAVAHRPEESIALQQLEQAAVLLERLARELLE